MAEIAIGQLISLFTDPEYKGLYRYNKETNSNKEITRIKEFTGRVKRAISKA